MGTIKTDYTTEALGRILSTMKGATRFEGLAAAFVDQCQELETAAYPILVQRSIDTAEGHRLDRIGLLVGIPRAGRTDEPYRLRIRAEIAILNSDGTEVAVTALLMLLVAQTVADFDFDESFPKAITLRARNVATGGTDEEQDLNYGLMQRAVSACTDLDYVYSLTEADDDDIFHFSNTTDTTETSATYGTENGALCGGAI